MRTSEWAPLVAQSALVCLLTACSFSSVPEQERLDTLEGAISPRPAARAGADQTVLSGSGVTLDGSASTGTGPLSYQWTQVSGPSVALSAPLSAKTTFTAPTVSSSALLRFSLRVSNSKGSSTDSVDITVNAGAVTCSGPITITTGGTYTGCWESSDPNTAAVMIATSQPVTITSSTIRHRGRGIIEWPNGTATNVTVTQSKLTALGPDTTADQRAIDLDNPLAFVAEHNRFTDGGGIWVGMSNGQNPSVVRVRFNEATNISRWQSAACSGGTCRQFFQATHVNVAGEVAWNRVTNRYGESWPEDNINLFHSGGLSDTARFVIHHNLIDGAWPKSSTADYTGGGIVIGDSGGQYATIGPGNRVINTGNYGIAISGGQHMRMLDNRSISDNTTNTGVLAMSSFGQAAINWCYNCSDATDNDATGNVLGLERVDNSRNDGSFPTCSTDPSSTCSNTPFSPSDITPAHEQAERDGWAADLAAAGLTIGPDW